MTCESCGSRESSGFICSWLHAGRADFATRTIRLRDQGRFQGPDWQAYQGGVSLSKGMMIGGRPLDGALTFTCAALAVAVVVAAPPCTMHASHRRTRRAAAAVEFV
jgi:hypothetical protein